MRWISCAEVVILLTLVPSAHGFLASIAGAGGAWALGTVAMLALVAVLPAIWPRSVDGPTGGTNIWLAAPVAITGLALLGWVSFRLLPAVFAGPLDPNRGDMLVIIEHAIAQFLSRFASRARDWRYGFNVLDLSFSYARPPDPPSGDRRALSAAVDWIIVR